MAVTVTLSAELEALMDLIGQSKVGHPSDFSRAFILSQVQANFDLVAAQGGGFTTTVQLRLRQTSDAKKWPYASEPTASFDFTTIVGDV
jgi:hypothetical protein